ncbi:TRAP transporter small permease [Bacillus sp. B15-48]|uniref:TRAP transporter small permease n=1 Tax=Bacillus sp. B15-48 TaxID=1548601 RepID=UPI00193F0947|nr:TRAP transporter small permease [Bacillus sp. B15-48]MBM4763323.1 TRAP transporter small permease subunit [Bacillus sp. B15-48]
MKRLNIWVDKLDYLLIRLAAITLFGMMLIIFLDASLRFFSNPLPGVMEMAEEYLMPMVVYLGISYTLQHKAHIKVDIFLKKLTKSPKRILNIITNLLGLIVFVYMGYLNLKEGVGHLVAGSTSRGLLDYPIGPAILIVSIGIFVFSLRTILETYFLIKGDDEEQVEADEFSVNPRINENGYEAKEEVK